MRSLTLGFVQILLAGALVLGAAGAPLAQVDGALSVSPSTIPVGTSSRLTITLTNGGVATEGVAFALTLPAGVSVAAPALLAQVGCKGQVAAVPAGDTVSLAGGRLGAGVSCAVSLDVTSSTEAIHGLSLGAVASDAGSGAGDSVDLEVVTDLPSFNVSIDPDPVGVDVPMTLTLELDNSLNPSAFHSPTVTIDLPPGVAIATPSNEQTDCPINILGTPEWSLGGADGSTHTLTMEQTATASFGAHPAGSVCTMSIDLVASLGLDAELVAAGLTEGVHELGRSPFELHVTRGHLGKHFTDDPVGPGSEVTVEYMLTNLDRDRSATDIAFSDNLDSALTGLVALGLPLTDVCGVGSMVSGTSVLSLSGGSLPPEGECSFSVTLLVPPVAVSGTWPSTTGEITATMDGVQETFGAATGYLQIASTPWAVLELLEPVISPGETATLRVTLTNASTDFAATDVTWLAGTTAFTSFPTGAVLPETPCGTGSVLSLVVTGNDSQGLELTGGTLEAFGSCTFEISINIPADAPGGVATLSTDAFSATIDGEVVQGLSNSASHLRLSAPELGLWFTDAPVVPGATVDLEFTLTAPDEASSDLTAIAFTADLGAALPGLTALGLPLVDPCGPGSTLTGTSTLTFAGGSLAPSEICSFTASVMVPASPPSGSVVVSTSAVTATEGGSQATGPGGQDTLIVGGLALSLGLPEVVSPGDSFTLEYTLSNEGADDATSVTFSHALGGLASAVTLSDVPASACGGTVTPIGSVLFVSEASVDAGTSCSLSITVNLPGSIATGSHATTTSALAATIAGGSATLPAASGRLVVADPLALLKSFPDDPATAGETTALSFTLVNANPTLFATSLAFTDDLDAWVAGAVAVGLPAEACGGTVEGTGVVSFSGGSLAPESSCTFEVTVLLPVGAPADPSPTNETSELTGTVGGLGTSAAAATAELTIQAMHFTRAFQTTPIAGEVTDLVYTLTNPSAAAIDGLRFADDLDALLPGLAALGLPQGDACGVGSTLSGTDAVVLDGARVDPGGSCVITVSVGVPAASVPGTYTGASEPLMRSGLAVAPPAQATLIVLPPAPLTSAAFEPPVVPVGASSTWTLTIDNSVSLGAATGLAFSASLPAGMLVASPPNAVTTCAGASVTAPPAAATLGMTGGTVAAESTCTVSLDVVTGGSGGLTLDTGAVTSTSPQADPATATLTVEPLPVLSAAFAPDLIAVTQLSTLTLTVDNSASTLVASDLAVSASLPVGLSVADPSAAANTCGGTFSAVAGSDSVQLAGGTVAPGASCTVAVDIEATSGGSHVLQTGDLTSTVGNLGTATAVVTVEPSPVLSIAAAPEQLGTGATTVVTVTIDNSASALGASSLDLAVSLPAELSVATPADASTSCVDGLMTAVSGSGSFSLAGASVAAGATCDVTVSVTGDLPGAAVLDTGELSSSNGPAASVSLVLTVEPPPLTVASLSPALIGERGASVLDVVIDNTASALPATGTSLTLALPPGLVIPVDPAAAPATDCPDATLVVAPDGSEVTLVGATVPALSTCTVTLGVTSNQAGVYAVDVSEAVSSNGTTSATSASLEVEPPPDIALAFAPDTVGSEATSALTVTLDNTNSLLQAIDIQLVLKLPAGLLVVDPAGATNGCGSGVFLAINDNITFADGVLDPGAACQLSVAVTAASPGSYETTTGPLTASTGIGDTATATLTVEPPVLFSAAVAPTVVGATQASTLTLTFDNSGSALDAADMAVAVALPAGLVLADPPAATTDCLAGDVSAEAGADAVSLSGGVVALGSSCSVSVDVVAPTAGTYLIETGPLATSNGGAGTASASLEVEPPPALGAAFGPPVIGATNASTLVLTIDNSASVVATTDLAVSASLPAGLAFALPASAATTCAGGTVEAADGLLSATGATVAGEASCTVSVDVTATSAALYEVTTGTLTSSHGVTEPATAALQVEPAPELAAACAPAVIGSGGVSTLTLTVDNSASQVAADALAVSLELPEGVVVASPSGAQTSCGAGGVAAAAGGSSIALTGGAVGAGATCTVTLGVTSVVAGSYTLISQELSTSNGIAPAATAALQVEPPPVVSAALAPALIGSGATSTFTVTVDNGAAELPADALSVVATLPAGVTLADPAEPTTTCAGGTLTAASGVLSYVGGSAAAQGACTVSVVISAAAAGTFQVATDPITSTNGASGTASATLQVEPPPTVSASLAPATIGSTGVTTWTLTIDNSASALGATGLTVSLALLGPVSVATPSGAASTCAGGNLSAAGGGVSYVGGAVGAGASCTISVDLTAAQSGLYQLVTAPITSSSGASGTASATLAVEPPPSIALAFEPAVVAVGAPATVTLTVDNAASSVPVVDLVARIELPAGLGFAPGAAPLTTCEGGILDGSASVLVYSGGALGAGLKCTLSAGVVAPAPGSLEAVGGPVTSSSGVSGTTTASLAVQPPPKVSGAFTPATIGATHNSTLVININNSASQLAATGLGLSFGLPAGLELVGLSTTCQGGTLGESEGLISYSGGSVGAGVLCQVSVVVTTDVAGEYGLATGLISTSAGSAPSVNAALAVEPAPLLAAAISPGLVRVGEPARLTLTVDNSASALGASALALSVALPPSVVFAVPLGDVSDCGAGTLTLGSAPGGGPLAAFTGGAVTAGASCTVSFEVTSAVPGAYTLTVPTLATSSGPADGVGASFEVEAPPTVAAWFDPAAIGTTGTTTLVVAVDNGAGTLTYGELAFDLQLEPGVVASQASTDCGAGVATASGQTISLDQGEVGGGAGCSLTATVTGLVPGAYAADVATVQSQAGDLGPASASLVVEGPPLLVSTLAPRRVASGESATLRLLIDNTLSSVGAGELTVAADLSEGLVVAADVEASTTCEGGALSAAPGAGLVELTGGSVGPGASCLVTVGVTAQAPGDYEALVGALSTSSGPSPGALLTVSADPPPLLSMTVGADLAGVRVPVAVVISVDNSDSGLDATDLAVALELPEGVVVSAAEAARTTCVWGSVEGAAGGSRVALVQGIAPAGGACELAFAVEGLVPGLVSLTTSDLSGSTGLASGVTAGFTVEAAPALSAVLDPAAIDAGGEASIVVTVDHTAATLDASDVSLTVALPDGVDVAGGGSTNCAGGQVQSSDDGRSVTFAGGLVAAGTLCEVFVHVTAPDSGTYLIEVGDLTSSSGPAEGLRLTLVVRPVGDADGTGCGAAGRPSGPGSASWILAALVLGLLGSRRRRRGLRQGPQGLPTC